jgi:RNA polymerase sigma-70 factor (ECF subfamily)
MVLPGVLTDGGAGAAVAAPDAGAVSALAVEVRELAAAGAADEARDRFGDLVGHLQRRASRIAFHYLRDFEDADEAVQDAFVRAYRHIGRYDESWPFEVWFSRILVNACLDRVKSRTRRARWVSPLPEAQDGWREPVAPERSPESRALAAETSLAVRAAIDRLPDRQRLVVLLSHLGGRSMREIAEITGLAESTVRVHLFRAVRRLRSTLADRGPHARGHAPRDE